MIASTGFFNGFLSGGIGRCPLFPTPTARAFFLAANISEIDVFSIQSDAAIDNPTSKDGKQGEIGKVSALNEEGMHTHRCTRFRLFSPLGMRQRNELNGTKCSIERREKDSFVFARHG